MNEPGKPRLLRLLLKVFKNSAVCPGYPSLVAPFAPLSEKNSTSVLWVIRGATALVPVLFVIASAWAARKYSLGTLRHQEILEELDQRRVAREASPSAGGGFSSA